MVRPVYKKTAQSNGRRQLLRRGLTLATVASLLASLGVPAAFAAPLSATDESQLSPAESTVPQIIGADADGGEETVADATDGMSLDEAAGDEVPSLSVDNDGAWDLGDSMEIDVDELVSEPEEEEEYPETPPAVKPAIITDEQLAALLAPKTDEAEPETAESTTVQEALPLDALPTTEDLSGDRVVSQPTSTGDSGNSYPYGQCTWYAYERRKELGLPVGSFFGNGGMWGASALALGYLVDNRPQVGDIVSFQPGQEWADPTYGHVAIVEKVNDDGSIEISEMNVKGVGITSTRTISATAVPTLQFIH